MLIVFLFILFTGSPVQIIYGSSLHSSQLHIKYGGHALNALQRLLKFFESNANNLNLDGLYGLRIAQGQLNALEETLTSSGNKQRYLTDKNNIIHSLSTQIERIANISLNAIAREQSFYLHRFSLVANQSFLIEYQTRRIKAEFIEQGSSDRPHAAKCLISKSCWNLMISPMSKNYRLTHQLLWFLIAKNIGCVDQERANEKLDYFEDHFCANIYEDARFNLLNNINQDLFLEQLLLCSMIGYEEFLRLDWLNTILTWQHPDYDCFSDESEIIRFHRQRQLLVEQEMNHGCLSHKSGLAAGLLATYSRVFCNKIEKYSH